VRRSDWKLESNIDKPCKTCRDGTRPPDPRSVIREGTSAFHFDRHHYSFATTPSGQCAQCGRVWIRRVPPTAPKAGKRMTGKRSKFRGKVRAPVSITLTSHHHTKVDRNMKRLGLTRSDFIALLIDRYGDHVSLEESHAMCPECGQADAVEAGACRFCKAVLPPGTYPPARP
jgi:hypothetical protein